MFRRSLARAVPPPAAGWCARSGDDRWHSPRVASSMRANDLALVRAFVVWLSIEFQKRVDAKPRADWRTAIDTLRHES
jgi:hypothetical protein